MADVKTSDETAANALDGSELVRIVQGGNNRRATVQDIADLGDGGTVLTGSITEPTDFVVITPLPELPTGYHYALRADNIALDGPDVLIIQTSEDGGDTWISGNTDYLQLLQYWKAGGDGSSIANYVASGVLIPSGTGSTAGLDLQGNLYPAGQLSAGGNATLINYSNARINPGDVSNRPVIYARSLDTAPGPVLTGALIDSVVVGAAATQNAIRFGAPDGDGVNMTAGTWALAVVAD